MDVVLPGLSYFPYRRTLYSYSNLMSLWLSLMDKSLRVMFPPLRHLRCPSIKPSVLTLHTSMDPLDGADVPLPTQVRIQ